MNKNLVWKNIYVLRYINHKNIIDLLILKFNK